jgi:predicted O-methyltransferase YrrM
MSEDLWTAVDRYVDDLFVGGDPALDAALAASATANLPNIQVTPSMGKLLYILAQLAGARRILELGTLGGYSTIWLARALPPGGRVVTIEVNDDHARVARENFARANVADRIDLRLGAGIDVLPRLDAENPARFDLVFIDADKPSYPDYLEWAIRLSRPGGLIVADNVVRDGKVIDASATDANVKGVRRFNELVAADRRVTATIVQTVGAKGYDGFAVLHVQTSEVERR